MVLNDWCSQEKTSHHCVVLKLYRKKRSSNPLGLFRCKWIIAQTHAISINSLRKHK